MKKALLFFLLISPAFGQRYDNFASTVASASGIGSIMQAIPNATITVCNFPGTGGTPCTNKATTYTSQTLITSCALSTQVVLQGSSTCQATGDIFGNFGFWAVPAKYTVCIGANNVTTICGTVIVPNDPVGVAIKPAASGSDAVVYVSNNGSDSNDCKSWGSACLTVAHACSLIPNQDTTCIQPLGFGTLYIADTFSGSYPAGLLPTSGPDPHAKALKLLGPGFLQADSSLASARGSIFTESDAAYIAVQSGGFQEFIQAGPRGKECFPITNVTIASGTLTVTCTNTFAATETARITGTAEAFLNGQVCTVASATGSQWTTTTAGCISHGNFTGGSEPGNALAEEKFLLATSTLTLPDITNGTGSAQSGVLLGITGATDATASGHCLWYNGTNLNTGLSGLMSDSGMGCNSSLTLPDFAHGIIWPNSSNRTFLAPYVAPTGSWNQQLMDKSGMVAVNATGDTVYGTYRVTADQTITAGASLTNIPGLSWTMPANQALNVAFSCHLLYSQATAAASDQFGIQDVSVAPTSLMAKSQAYLSASTFTAGNLPALTTTTATAIVTFTPSAATTVWNADIDGLIEQPSNASTSAINIMAQFTTNNGTIKRGSFCTVF